MIQTYVFIDSANAGSTAVIADLLESVQGGGAVGALPAAATATGADDRLVKHAAIVRWSTNGEAVALQIPDSGVETLFIVTDGHGDLVDQIEALSLWLRERAQTYELARIIAVVDSALFCSDPHIAPWLDACVHFSDFVLFAHREGVPNKWFSDVRQRFAKLCYPCQFDFVKDGRVRNPAELLCPEARRMTLAFDFELPLPDVAQEASAAFEYEIEDESGEPVEAEDVEDEEEEVASEPYFERDAAGRRKIRLPLLPR